MALIERRSLLRSSTAAVAATLAGGPVLAQSTTSSGAPVPTAKADAVPKAPPAEPVTHILARYAATAPASDIPPAVRHEAARTLVNWVGVAVGGSRQGAPDHAVRALLPFSGPPQAGLFGRTERMMRDGGAADPTGGLRHQLFARYASGMTKTSSARA